MIRELEMAHAISRAPRESWPVGPPRCNSERELNQNTDLVCSVAYRASHRPDEC